MYAQPSPHTVAPRRFENRALLDAVRLISRDLVKRAGISSPDRSYAALLSDIWGRSHFETTQVIAAKRAHARALAELNSAPTKQKRSPAQPPLSIQPKQNAPQRKLDLRDSLKRKNASRDHLVRLLKRVKELPLVANERRLTLALADQPALDLDAVRRLWGVPFAIFEAAGLQAYLANDFTHQLLIRFYDCHIARASPDARIFNILYWHESRQSKETPQCHHSWKDGFRCISKETIALVLRLLLTKRRAPLFENNMDVVVETVLFAINPDRFVHRFREPCLRDAGFFQGVQGYEYSRSYTGALKNLQLGKLNRMLKDIKAVKAIDKDTHNAVKDNNLLSRQALIQYCCQRGTLTDRALHAIFNRYVSRTRVPVNGCIDDTGVVGMSELDFVRMFLALVGSATDNGLKYWFSVLDQDGDGWVGVADVAYFYAERKSESEKMNGILLTDVRSLWIRLCAMTGVSPKGRGISFRSMKELVKADREFVACALLIRRADDGNLTNVAATMEVQDKAGKAP